MEDGKQELTNLELIEKLKGSDELNTLINNSNQSFWDGKIGSEVKTLYSNIDKATKEALGVDKPDDIKTSDWVKKNLLKLVDVTKELDTLKSKGDVTEAQTKLWNDKFNKLKGEIATKETEIESITQKGFMSNVSNQLDTFLVGKTFKPSYSEDDVKTLVDAKKAKIISNTKTLDNGKLAVINPSDNKYYLDTLGEPLTPTQVAEIEFKTMFHSKTPGGDATTTADTAAVIKGDIMAVDMNKVKSRQDFYNLFKTLMAPKGLVSHDQKYLEIQRATMEHYKVNALPLS